MKRRSYGLFITGLLMLALSVLVITSCEASAAADYQQGIDLFNAGNYDGAIQAMESAKSSDPTLLPGTTLILGSCYQAKKDYARAEQYLSSLLTMDSAVDAVKKDARFALARNHHLNGDLSGAVTLYQTYVTESPQDPRGQLWLGICYQELKKYRRSVAPLESAVALIPAGDAASKGEATWALFLSYCQAGDLDKALSIYQSGQTLKDPVYAELAIGRCYQMNGQADDAMKTFKDLAANHPDREEANEALLRVTDCLWIQGKYDDAIAYLDKLGKDRPDLYADTQYVKGETLDAFKGDREGALKVLGQLISELPEDHRVTRQAKVRSAQITMFGLHKPDQAREQLTRLLTSYSAAGLDTAELEYHLAFCSFAEGKCAQARDAFQVFCENHPNSELCNGSRYMLGECNVAVGDYAAARDALEGVIADDPDSDVAKAAALRISRLPESASRLKQTTTASKPVGQPKEVQNVKAN